MADSRIQPNSGGKPQPSPRKEVKMPEYDWEDIDWLEEVLPDQPQESAPQEEQVWEQPEPTQRHPIRRSAPPPRPARSGAPQRPQQQAPQQRTPRQQPPQQRTPQRQAPQQRAYEQPRQQPRPQPPRQPAYPQQPQPRRAVAVEPDDYRPHRRKGRKQSVPLIILAVILVGGILFAGGKLGSILLNYHRDRSAYNNLATDILSGLAEPNATTEPGATPEPEEVEPQSEVPITITPEKWNELRSINMDIVGWLYCPDTLINYPVLQTGDNDYYLHRSYDRQPNTAGALFADYNASLGITNSNFIIYGHNMKDGSMFATVYDYTTQEFYNQHPVMYLLTPTQNYRIDLIAAHITESSLDNYPGYFQGDEYQNYLNLITSSSFFRTSANVSTDYQLVTMSTCDYSSSYNDPRFLLHGLMVPVV